MPGSLVAAVADAVNEATGRMQRGNPVLPRTGGPAGNALLTAWTALALLALSVAELMTLFDAHGLITWHVAIGALLVPPALMKTASTGWRMVRYYLGNRPYQEAGPPPMLLRLLGPLVVVSTLALLGSGVLLVLLGESSAHQNLVSVIGVGVSWITLHQASFAVWVVAVGLHLIGRIIPALRITTGVGISGRVPGTWTRLLLLVAMAAAAIALAVVLVRGEGSWVFHGFDFRRAGLDD
ncbi:MAG: hypothetical protein ACRDPI_00600 [Nocardioidaceae bacterium]